eukprot:13894878-Alexandrium_andersonii.AAC.1
MGFIVLAGVLVPTHGAGILCAALFAVALLIVPILARTFALHAVGWHIGVATPPKRPSQRRRSAGRHCPRPHHRRPPPWPSTPGITRARGRFRRKARLYFSPSSSA